MRSDINLKKGGGGKIGCVSHGQTLHAKTENSPVLKSDATTAGVIEYYIPFIL